MSRSEAALTGLLQECALFWQPPDTAFWQDVADGRVDESVQSLAIQAGNPSFPAPGASFRELLPPLTELRSFFQSYFTGAGKTKVLPVESIYKKWTEDPTARLPLAASTGYLMGDSALHIQYLLEQFGFRIPGDYPMMPDHLAVLLELAVFLRQNCPRREADLFLAQHLDWLGDFARALQAIDPDGTTGQQAKEFYLQAVELLRQTVALHVAAV